MPEQHPADRRVLPPRRSDLERRVGERRLALVPLPAERREGGDRRDTTDRRRQAARRGADAAPPDRLVALVVSDQDDDARWVRELIRGATADPIDVRAAAPASSAARLARGGVDVALLVVSGSGRRGFATFAELRAVAPGVPFLLLSDVDDERGGLQAVRAGAQDFLVKGRLDGPLLLSALRHAVERNRLHAALLDWALVDDLTGLYNRRGFLTLATRDLHLARRTDETLLVAFADVDELKSVNDTWGHAAGDRSLRDAALVLRQTFRDSDLVARIGGDEYVVLVRHATPESARNLEDRLRRRLGEFNRRAERPYALSLSLGFAWHRANALPSVARLLERADRALYRDKRRKGDEPESKAGAKG